MNKSNKLLSDIVSFRTYARYLPELNRRESLEETINRNMNMHLQKFPKLSKDILKAYDYVHDLKVMPSMRSLQFGGDAILKNNTRIYNCSFLNINYIRAFAEAFYLLLCGTGVGYSVQSRHISKLPPIRKPKREETYVINDSVEGWAESVDRLVNAYFYGSVKPIFDYSKISPKDTQLTTIGAKAPGPEPLKKMLETVDRMLTEAIGRKLRAIECHDLMCIISDAVLAGGIRRAALIALFDKSDKEMLTCKHGEWWVKHPHRARANNSAILDYETTTQEEFNYIFDMCIKSNSGEPGFSWSHNMDMGFNPCVTGDTEILTSEGYKRIDSVVNQQTTIWNGFEWSEVTPKITGRNQEILKVNFSDGRSLNCTLYHKFHISIDYRGGSTIVEAKNLEPGMKLIKHDFPVIEKKDVLDNAYTQGFISAEGMEHNKTLYVYKPKEVCLERISNKKSVRWDEANRRYSVILNSNLVSKNFVPLEYNIESRLNWFAGLIDGDGTELLEGGLQIVSVNLEFLKNVQKLLSITGVQSKIIHAADEGYRALPDGKGGSKDYFCQKAYRLCVGSVQMQTLKSLGLKCERLSFDKEPQRDASQFVKIKSIEVGGFSELVYCFNEPKNHTGIFGGVITGQCHEISLNSNQVCNLTTTNLTGTNTEQELLARVKYASLLGTLQASYTDFPYLNGNWREVTEREALLGVSFTGIADAGNFATAQMLSKAAKVVLDTNEEYARKIGINLAARATAIKPEGSSSCVLGSSSGVHARFDQYYLRRVRMNSNDDLAQYLIKTCPELVEKDLFSTTGIVVTIPQESPAGSILRQNESALDLFNRVKLYNSSWVAGGHRSGDNKHNVSCTINYTPEEIEELKLRMWEDRHSYSGISLLPADDTSYSQMPFESCDKKTFEKYNEMVGDIDLTKVSEVVNNTNVSETVACGGGVCEII